MDFADDRVKRFREQRFQRAEIAKSAAISFRTHEPGICTFGTAFPGCSNLPDAIIRSGLRTRNRKSGGIDANVVDIPTPTHQSIS